MAVDEVSDDIWFEHEPKDGHVSVGTGKRSIPYCYVFELNESGRWEYSGPINATAQEPEDVPQEIFEFVERKTDHETAFLKREAERGDN